MNKSYLSLSHTYYLFGGKANYFPVFFPLCSCLVLVSIHVFIDKRAMFRRATLITGGRNVIIVASGRQEIDRSDITTIELGKAESKNVYGKISVIWETSY